MQYFSTPAPQKKGTPFLYSPSLPNFKISRTRLELFLSCRKCFVLDCKHGIRRPGNFTFPLSNAVDKLSKTEMNLYRSAQKPHPIFIKNDLAHIIPYDHPLLPVWQDRYQGVQYVVPQTNIVLSGVLDDVLFDLNSQKLVVLDYKTTSQDGIVSLDAPWHAAYKRQLEIYRWLLMKNGHEVSEIAYFFYSNGDKNAGFFNAQLNFDLSLVPHFVQGNSGWIEGVAVEVFECLRSDIMPESDDSCDFCCYSFERRDVEC